MRHLLVRFAGEESGEDLIEYALLVAMAAAVVTATVINDPLGVMAALKHAFARAKDALENA